MEPTNVASDELRSIINRIEAQNERIADETEVRKAIYDEAKGRGYDGKVLRKIIAMRKRKADDLAEEEAILELYRQALGMA